MSMSNEQKLALFDELIVASSTMATVCANFSSTLSERFEDGVMEQVNQVRDVLNRCPQPRGIWDGDFREEHLQIETYQSSTDRALNRNACSVKITHLITGVSRVSSSKPTAEENEQVARQSLKEAVSRRWAEMHR